MANVDHIPSNHPPVDSLPPSQGVPIKGLFKFGSRQLLIADLDASVPAMVEAAKEGFVAMLPAYTATEVGLSMRHGRELRVLNCKEFVCVGPHSDDLHDSLDAMLEEFQEIHIVTTSFLDEKEAAERFVFAVNGAESRLLVGLIAGRASLAVETLKFMADNQ